MDLWKMDIRRFGDQYRSRGYSLARTYEVYSTYYDIVYPNHERRPAGRCGRRRPTPATSSSAPSWARRAAGSGSTGTGRTRTGEHEWPPATGLGRPALVDRHRHRAPRLPAGRGAVRRVELRQDRGHRPGRSGVPPAAVRQRRRQAARVRSPTRRCSTPGAGSSATSRSRGWTEERFLIVTGHRVRAPRPVVDPQPSPQPRDAPVAVSDVTSSMACFGLWGPTARDVLSEVCADDLGFRYMSARRLTVGDVPCLALRVTYVGELGWELYPPAEYGLRLWDTLDGGRAGRTGSSRRVPRHRLAAAGEGLPRLGLGHHERDRPVLRRARLRRAAWRRTASSAGTRCWPWRPTADRSGWPAWCSTTRARWRSATSR